MEYNGVEIYEIPALSCPDVPVGYMFVGDLLIFGNFEKLGNIIDEASPLVVSEDFAQINSRFPDQSGLLWYISLRSVLEMLMRSDIQSGTDLDLATLQKFGSVAGVGNYDGEGLKLSSEGTSEANWLEVLGGILLFIYPSF